MKTEDLYRDDRNPEKLLLRNCTVRERKDSWYERGAIVIEKGYIKATGPEKALLGRYGDYPDRDLGGRTVLAGFNDAHLHFYQLGKDMNSTDLSHVSSLNELKATIRDWSWNRKTAEEGLVRAVRLDDSRLPGGKLPGREELDRIMPGRPLLVERICYHAAAVNSKALEYAGIDAGSDDPEGGRIGRDRKGRPDGRLYDAAVNLIKEKLPSPGPRQRREHLLQAGSELLSEGITSVTADDLGAESDPGSTLTAYEMLVRSGEPHPRLHLEQRVEKKEDIAWLKENSSRPGRGDIWLRFGPLKIMLDGSLGAETAALTSPYAGGKNRGDLLLEKEKLQSLMEKGYEYGFYADIHAIGDRAIETVIRAYEDIEREKDDIRPPNIVHCQLPNPDQIERMAALNIKAIIQPAFVGSDWKIARERLSEEQLEKAYAWRSMAGAGVKIAGSSDAPIESVDPLPGIHRAVTRQDGSGRPPGGFKPEEKLTLETALDLFTTAGADFSGEAEIKGSLRPGQLADMALISSDPRRVKPEEIKDLRVEETYLGGTRVYSSR